MNPSTIYIILESHFDGESDVSLPIAWTVYKEKAESRICGLEKQNKIDVEAHDVLRQKFLNWVKDNPAPERKIPARPNPWFYMEDHGIDIQHNINCDQWNKLVLAYKENLYIEIAKLYGMPLERVRTLLHCYPAGVSYSIMELEEI